jgi:ABC-type antimicrobial peptide transport system permease subunit
MKVNAQSYQSSIDEVKKLWESTYPEHIFEYTFLDEQIKEFYEGEAKMSALLTIFSSMAIFIGCLGLFGLATFMANQKTKEIGVRKVMGASVENILMMFSKEFIILIVIGFLFAGPLAWWAMSQFLSQFAFKIDLGAWIFLAGIGSTLALALITVGYKSFRAATANPVKSLRYE